MAGNGPDPAAAQRFLRRACSAIQNYDEEGGAVVPAWAWSHLLDDLGLQDGDEATAYLMDHLEPAGPGSISYRPMLEALGVSFPGPGAGLGDGGGPGPGSNAGMPAPGGPRYGGQSRGHGPHGGETMMDPHMDDDNRDQGAPPRHQQQQQRQMQQQTTQSPHRQQRGSDEPTSRGVMPTSQSPSRPQPDDGEEDSVVGGSVSVVGDLEDEDEETFWARRGSAIQRLYHQWDCNQLSNATFTEHLQSVLGDRADLRHEDSEFLRLVSKHDNARNMKFATLMSALRHDARKTMARRYGWPTSGLSSATSYAGSYAGSVCGDWQAPSEVGSEAPSHAAGRPTRPVAVSDAGSAGRRHFHMPSSAVIMSPENMPKSVPSSGFGRGTPARAPTAQSFGGNSQEGNLESLRHRGGPPCAGRCGGGTNSAGYPGSGGYTGSAGYNDDAGSERCSGGCAGRGMSAGGNVRSSDSTASGQVRAPDHSGNNGGRQLNLDPDFWSRVGPRPPPQRGEAAPSELGQSEVGSMYSQRTGRSNQGHGNILTWGNDSRNLTPERRRQGRQITMDDKGTARSHASSRIFP